MNHAHALHGAHRVARGVAAAAAAAGVLAEPFVRAGEAWRRARVYRQTITMLSDLDDAVLHDIGVRRDEIRHLARLAAEHPGIDPRDVIGR